MGKASISTVGAFAILVSLFGAAHAQTPNFLAQEGPEMWSASKLRGVAIFGPGDKKVGTISEILLDHSGTATTVVIGVGGFLGIGEKEVAIPFDQVKFTDQPVPGQVRPPVAPGGANANDGAAIPTTTALGMPADTTGNPNSALATGGAPGINGSGAVAASDPLALGAPARTTTDANPQETTAGIGGPDRNQNAVERSTAYPDHGMIDLTADQLKAAPAFKFAR